MPPYFDGRVQLKQNLIFLLRAATVNHPFYFEEYNEDYFPYYSVTNSAAYAYSGFNNPFFGVDGFVENGFDVFSPFQNNYVYLNFVFSLANLNIFTVPLWELFGSYSGHIMTGVVGQYGNDGIRFNGGLGLWDPPAYQFQPPTVSGTPIAAVLPIAQTQWLASYPLDSPEMYYDPDSDSMISYGYLEEIGVTPSYDAGWNHWETMAGNARNVYGLPFLSVKMAYGNSDNTAIETNTLSAGSQVENVDGYFYPQTAQPQFQTVEYDFWTYSPLPGSTNFSPSQAGDLLMTTVGTFINYYPGGYFYVQPEIQINGYAKLAVLNGYSGVYGYLGQYFDQAYTEDANGNATTNKTGILSPYGSFFATEPGPAALVTMPDIDTGERGVCTVNCCSMNVDKNNDSYMDLSFNGPDATSQASPMVWWINNDCDWAYYPGDSGKDLPCNSNTCDYLNQNIMSPRDLEDWARLWICGVPALTNAGYQVTLSWNVGSGSPAVNLVNPVEANGGIGYLTNADIAAEQTSGSTSSDPSYKFARVTPIRSLHFSRQLL